MTTHQIDIDREVILIVWRDIDNLNQHFVIPIEEDSKPEINEHEVTAQTVAEALDAGATKIVVDRRPIHESYQVEL